MAKTFFGEGDMKRRKSGRTLVLNADYVAMSVMDSRKALVDSIINSEMPGEGVRVLEYYDEEFLLDSKGREHFIPSIVVSANYIDLSKRGVNFTRNNVFIRDDCTCQYCGARKHPKELTFDHVIPRAKWDKKDGTPTKWDNIVTCCYKCNHRKGHKSVKEAGFFLRNEPVRPRRNQYVIGMAPWTRFPDSWLPYLPPAYKNFKKFIDESSLKTEFV